ncbi:MAG TPA: hypothetical protein VG407_12690 [Caulobacteraceae bacterium]|jgi:hypothetical protein|nr:hypothetical protein [Caulobacteraceae bacterium]
MFDHIADPDIRREAERLRRGELVRRDAAFARHRRAAHDSVPVTADPVELTSDTAIERAAANIVAGRRAWRKTPEGRFVLALNDIRAALERAGYAEDAARAAQNRDFNGERETCEHWAGALCDVARQLKSAALDAQLAAIDATACEVAPERVDATAA